MTAEDRHEQVAVVLPAGPVEVSVASARPVDAWATLVLAHGAGSGYAHPFLVGFARALCAEGVATVRFNFPYAERGRRMPGPSAHAIAAWQALMAYALERSAGPPVWAAGKSYGGRMASMAAAEGVIAPAGLVYLGYPLHPPGDPAKARSAHLPAIAVPQLFVEGTNDPFIAPRAQFDDAVAACQDARVHWVEGGGHSFEVKGARRAAEEIGADLAPTVVAFLREGR